jgi:AcrR family transcriptional regulator
MRKRPRQIRSQQMVESLVEATGQIVAERGLSAASTNQIAMRAGVSIGSLYQYFENKEALIEALLDRMSQDLGSIVDILVDDLADADAHTVVRGLLDAVVTRIEASNGVYLELVRNWHQLPSMRVVDDLERHMFEVCRVYAMRHMDRFRNGNLHPMLYVVINATLMTLVRYLGQSNSRLRRDEVLDCLSDMVAGYIVSQQRPPRPAVS